MFALYSYYLITVIFHMLDWCLENNEDLNSLRTSWAKILRTLFSPMKCGLGLSYSVLQFGGFVFFVNVSFDFCWDSECHNLVHEQCHYRSTSFCLHSCNKLHSYGLIMSLWCCLLQFFAITKNLTHMMNNWKINIFKYELIRPLLLPHSLLNNPQISFPGH